MNLDSNKKSLTKGGRGKGGGEVEAELYIEKEVCQTKLQKEKAHIILQEKETPGSNNEKEPAPRGTKREPECTNRSSSPRENLQFYTRLLSLNVNRLVSKKQKLKQIAATAHMEHTGVLCIQGTWLQEEIKSVETHIPGYVEYRSNRKHRTGGGTSIYVWDKYTVLRSEKFSNGVCECQMVKIKELNLTVVNFYRPPGSDINSFQEALDKVSHWLEEDKFELVMLGDFNLPEIGM